MIERFATQKSRKQMENNYLRLNVFVSKNSVKAYPKMRLLFE